MVSTLSHRNPGSYPGRFLAVWVQSTGRVSWLTHLAHGLHEYTVCVPSSTRRNNSVWRWRYRFMFLFGLLAPLQRPLPHLASPWFIM